MLRQRKNYGGVVIVKFKFKKAREKKKCSKKNHKKNVNIFMIGKNLTRKNIGKTHVCSND